MAALTTTALMALSAANTASQFAGQRQQATAVTRQGQYEASIYQADAGLADQQAQDAIARGHEAELKQLRETRQLVGAQRAALGAQGVEVNDGSAIALQAEAAKMGELDALTIRNNARREAFGYKVQAADLRNRGQLALYASRNQAAGLRAQSWGTLLTGAVQTYGISQQGK